MTETSSASLAVGASLGRWRTAVMTAFALGGVAVSTWGPRLPELRSDLGVGNGAIGLVLAGVAVGSVAGLSTSSALLSWLGSRRGICATLWLAGAAIATIGVGAGLAHSVVLTTVGFAMVGFGIGAADVMINVEGAAVERAAGKTLMPMMHAAWSPGAIVGAAMIWRLLLDVPPACRNAPVRTRCQCRSGGR